MAYTVGSTYNFNTGDMTPYTIGTIEYRASTNDYVLRIGYKDKSGEYIFFNSYHKDFNAANCNIDFMRAQIHKSVYNYYGSVINIHTSPTLGTTIEVLTLITSFNLI